MTMPRQKPNRSKQDYATPENFMAAIRARLGIQRFMFDFAASPENTKADRYFTEQQNAHVQDWAEYLGGGDWGWLNPPFSRIEPWAQKCFEVRCNKRQIAFLVPASVGADWFRDYVDGKALVLCLNGRLAFIEGKPRELYPKDCICCLYSPDIEPGYEVWDWRKEVKRRAA